MSRLADSKQVVTVYDMPARHLHHTHAAAQLLVAQGTHAHTAYGDHRDILGIWGDKDKDNTACALT